MSVLDGGTFEPVARKEAGFPANDKDARKLLKVIMTAVHNPKVQQTMSKAIENAPDRTPDIVAKISAMLCQRIMAQVQQEYKVQMPQKNVIGMILTIVAEVFSLVERMGSPPATPEIIKETARLSAQLLDQMRQAPAGKQEGPPQGQPPQEQGSVLG